MDLNKKRILIVEDEKDIFDMHKKSFEELGYEVFPPKNDTFHQESTNIQSFEEFFNRIVLYITKANIDILSLDLQLSKFEYNFLKDDSNTADENLGGIKIIEHLSKSNYHHIRTLPIIIISKFNEGDILRINADSKYAIEFIAKSNLDNSDDNNDTHTLKTYIEKLNLDEKFTFEIEKYNRFNFLEFKSIYGNREDYFNFHEKKKKTREVTEETLKEKKDTLINAIDGKCEYKITSYYQGIFDKNKKIDKYEVLARVETEAVEAFFIYNDVAIFYGLISTITQKIITESFKNINNTNQHISINIPYEDLKKSNFEFFKNYLNTEFTDNSLENKGQITLEILEGVKQDDEIVNSIKELSDDGYKIAIDDFGIENSNFLRLKELIDKDCINFIKIDGAFIKNITTCKVSEIIVKSIVSLVEEHNKDEKKKRIKIVAEFIRNEDIFNFCKGLKIDLFQGFYLNEPSESFSNDYS